MRELEGKTILVTGATKGIGSEIVRSLHNKGAYVIGHYGSDESSAVKIREVYPVRAIFLKQSLTDAHGAAALWQDALNSVGKIDVLVNNAGFTP